MFARYARAPNALGYCGPAAGLGATEPQVRAAARRFSGAWPYLHVLARLTGTADPLEHRLVEGYWLGRDLGVDRRAFGEALLAAIGPQAGAHWAHLTPQLLPDAAPDHAFHVFAIYPWSRLLTHGAPAALGVLDGCRIRSGIVLSRTRDTAVVTSRHLSWDGTVLGLAEPVVEEITVAPGLDPEPGEQVALHWDTVCDRLLPAQVTELERSTAGQFAATNRRLGRESA